MKSKYKTYWIGTDDNPKDRTLIDVAEKDVERMPQRGDRSGRVVRVFDHRSGKYVRVRTADCGMDCWCAMEFVDGRKS